MAQSKDILDQEATDLILDLILEYDRLGLRASGNYARSLRKEVSSTRLQIFGAGYAQQMQNGRRPTVNRGDGSVRLKILEWIRVKGIQPDDPKTTIEQLSYAITNKIHREGIKVPNQFNPGGVISNVITEARIQEIVNKVRFGEVERISSEIANLFIKQLA